MGKALVFQASLQAGHGYGIPAADIDAAQQDYVGIHRSSFCLTELGLNVVMEHPASRAGHTPLTA
jgi:hypothetical protein